MRAANVLSFVRGQTANGGALALFRQLNGIRFNATNHPSDEKFHQLARCLSSLQPKHTVSSSSAAEFEDSQDLDFVKSSPGPEIPSGKVVRPFSEIPGPPGLPFIGTLWDYVKKDGLRFNKMFEVMEMRAAMYGPIYQEQFGHLTSVVISDPAEYLKVIRVDGKYPIRFPLEPLAHYQRKRGIGLGIGNGQGEEWYRIRAVVSKKMLRPYEVFKHVGPMDETATDFVQHIERKRQDDGSIPDLEHEIFKWALESIGTMLFEERIGCISDPPPQQAKDFIENLIGSFKYLQMLMYSTPFYRIFPTKNWRIYERYTDRMWQIGQTLVNKRVAALKRQEQDGVVEGTEKVKSEFLTHLLSNTDLSPEEVNAICLDLLMAAVDTTSNVLLFVLYCLSRNPSVQETLYRETVDVLPNEDRITQEKLQDMQYVKACIRETFRMYPIVHTTSRRITKDIEVCGFHVPAGTHCQANLYGMGRNPELFSEPLRYMPERWLRENHDGQSKALANLPFGHGPRMCIGRRMAEQELYLAVSKIIQKFKIEYNSDEDVQPVLNLFMTPDRPMKLTFTHRTPELREERRASI